MLSIITINKAYLLSCNTRRKFFQNFWVQNLKKVAVESEEGFMRNKITGKNNQQGKEGISFMQKQSFMRADEVAQELGISKSHAYKVIHGLNEELQEKGYLTISGRVNREFFREKYYYTKTVKEES